MMDLDQLLASLQASAADDLADRPLLAVSDYEQAAQPRSPAAMRAAHFYVGCLGLWLARQGALLPVRIGASGVQPSTVTLPDMFSEDVLRGSLVPADIAEPLRAFVVAYARDSTRYADDYEETLVVDGGLRDMFDVASNLENFNVVARVVDWRYRRYSINDRGWNAPPRAKTEYQLSDGEKAEAGWLHSFATCGLPSGSERGRRKQLQRFWALVDHAPAIASSNIVAALVSAFVRPADSSVMQAVFNTLKAMHFDWVLRGILADAHRLHESGWLEPLLGTWSRFDDAQLAELDRQLQDLHGMDLLAVQAAVREGLKSRSQWATQVEQLL